MAEIVTQTTAEAIKSRLARALCRLHAVHTSVWEAALIAEATFQLAHALRISAVSRFTYYAARPALFDAVANLQGILDTEIFGIVVRSAPDLMQCAREIENACKAISQDKSQDESP